MCILIPLEVKKQEDHGNKEAQANTHARGLGCYDCLLTCEMESVSEMSKGLKGTFICSMLIPAPAVFGSWWNGMPQPGIWNHP